MGKIRSKYVKSTTKDILRNEAYASMFSNEFANNKEALKTLIVETKASKHLRNRIAGYLTRQKRILERESSTSQSPFSEA